MADDRDAFITGNYIGQEAKSFFLIIIIGPRYFLYTEFRSRAQELLRWVDVVSVGRRSSAEC